MIILLSQYLYIIFALKKITELIRYTLNSTLKVTVGQSNAKISTERHTGNLQGTQKFQVLTQEFSVEIFDFHCNAFF